ncbi:OSM9 [Trichuris trichiura]|uniref:OSM9 n=1 Tax=Trichuris trichiura TaxID=36087 RepID=A0A077YWL7_TRITR|nr:OSM9 [Trichuris trichiura]
MRFFWRRHDRTPYDPDGKWTNVSREVERNNIYKWLQRKKRKYRRSYAATYFTTLSVHSAGSLIEVFEQEGREGVLRFAAEKVVPMLYNDGVRPETVRESDYIKWRKFMRTNLSENVDRDDKDLEIMKTIQFHEHPAQWKLNRRGVRGETLLHLLLASNDAKSTEIARILLCEYPTLSLDLYEDEEMFGQSCLHLAILHNDYATVCLLLECGAKSTQRTTGRFFWPSKYGTKYESSNEIADSDASAFQPSSLKGPYPPLGLHCFYALLLGLAYFGEYPLAFAASFGNKDIYDALIDFGANPNAQDSFGNTVLHMCVIHNSIAMYTYAVRHSNQPADVNVVNAIGCTPLALATKLGRKEIFEEMLELSGVEFWRFSDITVSAYPLTALDTINADGSTNWDSALMTIIKGSTPDHMAMVQSDVVQRLLADKWTVYGWVAFTIDHIFLVKKHLIIWTAFLVIYLFFMSISIYLRPANESLWDYRGFDGICRAVVETCTIVGSLLFIIYQSFAEIMMQGFTRYIVSLLNSFDQLLFLIENFLVICCIPCRLLGYSDVEEVLLVIVAPGSWLMLLFVARASILTGPFVHIIYNMITGDMMRFGLLSAVFLLAFALGKSVVFNQLGQNMMELRAMAYCDVGDKKSSYDTYGETVLTLFKAAFGGYEYELLECSHYTVLMKILFIIYLVIMPIMLINMLLAMMGNTYTTIIKEAEKAWRFQLAEMVIRLERYYNKEKLAHFQNKYSVSLGVERDSGLEKRGLMVIKQFRKTKAQQRKLAMYNWKVNVQLQSRVRALSYLLLQKLFKRFVEIHREKGPEETRNLLWSGTWAKYKDWKQGERRSQSTMETRERVEEFEQELMMANSNHVSYARSSISGGEPPPPAAIMTDNSSLTPPAAVHQTMYREMEERTTPSAANVSCRNDKVATTDAKGAVEDV